MPLDEKRTSATRLCKSLDALSQWLNVTFLPRASDTDADESTSGRCFWEAEHGAKTGPWRAARWLIDCLFFFDVGPNGEGHCELADQRDYHRAIQKVRRFEARQTETKCGRKGLDG